MSGILRIEQVCNKFGDQSVIGDQTLDMPSSQSLGVIGLGGFGKSILPRLLSGFVLPDSGRIEIVGDAMWRQKADARGIDVNRLRLVRAKVGMVCFSSSSYFHT